MLKVGLRGVFARKLRAFLTALAVFLGVALMTGTYVLTDTFTNSFGQIFEESSEGIDVAVVPREAVESEGGTEPPGMPARLLERVNEVEGVAEADGGIFASGVSLIDEDGDRIGSTQAPAFGASAQPERFDPFDYDRGPAHRRRPARWRSTSCPPTTRTSASATRSRSRAPRRRASTRSSASRRSARWTRSAARRSRSCRSRRRSGSPTRRASSTRSRSRPRRASLPRQLKRRVAQVMPRTVEVRTGEENAEQETEDIEDDLGFLKTALLIFAWIALFVGAFTIFNTFSITVAQRTREFGMLRTLGASRRQVLTSVLLEALVIGLIGAGLGVLAGIGVADLLNALFKSFGIDLPNTGSVVKTRSIVVPLLIGLVVTLLAAIIPAVRATRVSPMEALSDQAIAPTQRRRRFVTGLAILLSVGGVVAVCVGLFGGIESSSDAAALLGLGAVLLFFGTALLVAALRRAAGLGRRPRARARPQADRPACARERRPQPGPDGHDRGRVDDRPRPRHVRDRVRGRASRPRSTTRSTRASRAT